MKKQRSHSLRAAALIALICHPGLPSAAHAAGVVGTGTAASCTDAALDAALAGGGLVTFNCGPDPVTIDISTGTGTKTIVADTTIDGGGLITMSNRVGVFVINPGVEFILRNLKIVNSASAIANNGTLTVADSTFSDNLSGGCDLYEICAGGGISSTGSLTVTNTTFTRSSIYSSGVLIVADCTFTENNVGILSQGGQSTVSHSTFTGGVAGIITTPLFNHVGSLTVSNSTFSGNSGGGIGTYDGSLTVSNCTFTGNLVSIANAHEEPILLRNTIVVRATSDANNCGGAITDGGHNIDDGTSCGFGTTNGSLSNTNAQLDPAGLQDNGGPTQTVALCTAAGVPAGCTAASPAIDSGDQAVCAAAPVNKLDQRGFVRPGTGHTQCSIGAYEADSTAPVCSGDCNGNSQVRVDELVTLVNIALGNAETSTCPHGVPIGAEATIDVLIRAVNNAVNNALSNSCVLGGGDDGSSGGG